MTTAPEVVAGVHEWRIGEAEAALKRGAGTIGAIKSAALGALFSALGAIGHGLYQAAKMEEQLDRARQDIKTLAIQVEAIHGRTQEQRVRLEGMSTVADYERRRADTLETALQRIQERKR